MLKNKAINDNIEEIGFFIIITEIANSMHIKNIIFKL